MDPVDGMDGMDVDTWAKESTPVHAGRVATPARGGHKTGTRGHPDLEPLRHRSGKHVHSVHWVHLVHHATDDCVPLQSSRPSGDTQSRRGRRLEHIPVLCFLLRIVSRGAV